MTSFTLFVDSSWCPTTKVGGIGAWCKKGGWDRGHTFGGRLESTVKSSTQAELLGIVQAMEFLDRYNEFDNVSYLMVQCDSLNALSMLVRKTEFNEAPAKGSGIPISRAHKLKPTRIELLWLSRLSPILEKVEIKVVRHVRGHEAGATTRSFVNEQCDAIAKNHMRGARAESFNGKNLEDEGVRRASSFHRVERSLYPY